jgi:hypothetical protein
VVLYPWGHGVGGYRARERKQLRKGQGRGAPAQAPAPGLSRHRRGPGGVALAPGGTRCNSSWGPSPCRPRRKWQPGTTRTPGRPCRRRRWTLRGRGRVGNGGGRVGHALVCASRGAKGIRSPAPHQAQWAGVFVAGRPRSRAPSCCGSQEAAHRCSHHSRHRCLAWSSLQSSSGSRGWGSRPCHPKTTGPSGTGHSWGRRARPRRCRSSRPRPRWRP